MQGALNFRDSTQRIAVWALAVIVCSFAIQPCFINSHPCCPTQAPKCHEGLQHAVCALSTSGIARADIPAGLDEVRAESAWPVISLAVPTYAHGSAPTVDPTRGRLFLLNSVLLI
jgi:hypothetical protein